MNTPTSGGWRDVLILFRVVGSTGHICEMQIALHMLLTARKEMGAHAAYAQARHFIEIFEASSGNNSIRLNSLRQLHVQQVVLAATLGLAGVVLPSRSQKKRQQQLLPPRWQP